MKIKLFGGFSLIDQNGEVAPLTLRRAQALIAYLAVKPYRRESREVLVDLLWPDRFKEQAQASLRQVLFELKKIHPEIVRTSRNDVILGSVIAECDVWNFEELSSLSGILNANLLLNLFHGPFLDGPALATEPFQQWAAVQRARLENQLETAVLNATVECLGPVEIEQSVALLTKFLEIFPLCFQVLFRIMELSVHGGDPGNAVRQYEHFSNRVKVEFDEVPPRELFDLCVGLKAGLQQSPITVNQIRSAAFKHSNPWLQTLADSPVVAVLPFHYSGSQSIGTDLANGLCEDITLMLSGCRWFKVLSRSATHGLKPGMQFVPRDFARQTGAKHLVYGTLTERSDGLSLGVELVDAAMGHVTWAKRYRVQENDILNWATEICPLIVAALDPAIAEGERRDFQKSVLAGTDCLVAYRSLVTGYHAYYAADWDKAVRSFQIAIDNDDAFAHAYAMLATTQYFSAQVRRDVGFSDTLVEAEQNARRALEIDPTEPKANIALAQSLDWRGLHSETAKLLDRAAEINPSFALASTARSYNSVMMGSFENARSQILTSMRLRVGDAGLGYCLPSKALADLHLGNKHEALETAHWAMRLRSDFWLTRVVLATCLHSNNRLREAETTVEKLKADFAGLQAGDIVQWFPYANSSHGELMLNALQKSGWY